MGIIELRAKKKAAGMTNAQISELTGIPVSTVNKIFSGATKNPRYTTLEKIEKELDKAVYIPSAEDLEAGQRNAQMRQMFAEGNVPAKQWFRGAPDRKNVVCEQATETDNFTYPFDKCAEMHEKKKRYLGEQRQEQLTDEIYSLPYPDRIHQRIVHQLAWEIESYIRESEVRAEVMQAPFVVKLFPDREVYVQPDLSVITRMEPLTPYGYTGAPSLVIEVVSPGFLERDYITKVSLYQRAGVQQYWIVDPTTMQTIIYDFTHRISPVIFSFERAASEPECVRHFIDEHAGSILKKEK